MKDLIEALQIFYRYMPGVKYPTHCSHDELHVCVSADLVSDEDVKRLDELGFFISDGGFSSFRFGSC